MSVSESIQILLAINEQGATEARAKIQGVEKALNSLQNSQRSGGAPSGSLVSRLQSGLAEQKAALQSELTARSAVADKTSLVTSAEGRRAAQEKLSIELQAKAAAASSAAARKAAEIEYLGLLAKQKTTLLEIARLKYGIDKTPATKQAVTDAANALVAEKSKLQLAQGARAEQLKAAQLYANQAQNSKELVAERGLEVKAAQAALSIEQQRVVAAQQLVAASQQNTDKLINQRYVLSKPTGTGGATGPSGAFQHTAGGVGWVDPYTTGIGMAYEGADKLNKELQKTGKTGSTAMKQTGAATKAANASMRDFAIGARSVGSVLVGTSWQGGLYYMSQIGRTMKGAALTGGLLALAAAAVASGFVALVREGVKIEAISKSFANLTSNAGVAGEVLATKMQSASKYVMTLNDSMTVANRALLAGGEQFATELPRLLEIARSAALASGQDIAYTFNSLVTGIARGAPRLIDNADIYLRLGDATAEYAKQLGKSVAELSAQERQQATLNAVLKQGEEFTRKVGLQTKTAAEKYKSAATGIKDYINALALLTTEKTDVENFFDSIGNIFQTAAKSARELADPTKQMADDYIKALDKSTAAYDKFFKAQEELKAANQLPEFAGIRDRAVQHAGHLYLIAYNELEAAKQARDKATAIYGVYLSLKSGAYDDIPLGVAGQSDLEDKTKKVTALGEALEAFTIRLSERSGNALKERYEGLADSVWSIRDAADDFPEMPEIGALVLPADIANLRAWADVLKELGVPEDKLLEINSAINKLESSRPTAEEIEAALNRIFAEQPLTGTYYESAVTEAKGKLDDLAQKATEVGAGNLADNLRASAKLLRTELEQSWPEIQKLDAAGFQAWLDERTRGTEKFAQQEIDRREQLIEFQEKLADIASKPGPSLKGTTTNLPEIGTQLFSTDLTAIDAYYAKLERLEPENADLIKATRASIAELQNQKDAMLAAALAADDPIAALRELTQQEYGASTGLVELIGNLNNIPGAAVGSANGIRIFGAALDEIIAKMREPISLSAMVESIESGATAIQASAFDLAKYIGPERALATSRDLVDRYMADVRALGKRETAYDKDEWDVRRRYIEDYYTGIADSGSSYYDGLKSKSKEATASLKRDAGEVKSAIEAALSKGREVTPADMLATKAGTYKDAPLENARRLDAIAERGFAELKAHPDWAGILGIPPEIMGGTEDQLKAWAAQTSEDVDNLLRPDLIDWDAFIANYKKGLQDEATKELTLDIALGKLKTAGLLEGKTDKEARAEVLKMLGLEEPEVTFDSYFNESTSDDPAAKAWMDYLRTGKVSTAKAVLELTTEGAPPVETLPETKSTEKTSNSGSYKLSATTGEERAALIDEKTPVINKDVVGKQTTDVMLDAMNQAGKDIAGAMYASFDEAIKAQTPGLEVATYWGLDFEANIGMFESVGTNAGNAVGTAFVQAIETKTGKVRETLAKAVAGELLPELDRRYVRKGTPN